MVPPGAPVVPEDDVSSSSVWMDVEWYTNWAKDLSHGLHFSVSSIAQDR
jgi:hypothetical protein